MCAIPASARASACDSLSNTAIDSRVRCFAEDGISTKERLLRRRLRKCRAPRTALRSRATAKGAKAEPDETSHACRASDPRPTPNPPRGVGRGGLTPPPRPPAAALRRARPPPSDLGRAPRPKLRGGCELRREGVDHMGRLYPSRWNQPQGDTESLAESPEYGDISAVWGEKGPRGKIEVYN